ncbi:transmembrane protein [Thalictrum thalictroides]|uniref:Transmembrane protein n=1 Tax=Thalictrum thalictroides TaxID=46969 RepID=A0A7J6V368_THATH|nr:transmembrane protein [Thalictrum thalictroides]
MKPLSSLGIGLSIVFGCLFLALIAELYYLLWWKKRITNREIEDDDYSSPSRELFYLFCWKKPSSLSSTALNPQQLCNSVRMADSHSLESGTNQQLHLHSNSSKDLLLKPYGEDSIETELMRLHNLSGPPRFLFTIKEETKEDLESEDGKSKCDNKSRKGSRSRSLSDLLVTVETPFLTPLSSPAFYTPPLTPIDSYNHHGFNPLYESSTDAEINSIKASPPPKFKFLKDAEEKLQRRIQMEQRVKRSSVGCIEDDKTKTPSSIVKIEEDKSYITILVSKNQEKEVQVHHPHHHHSTSKQVLPLSSSPSAIRTVNKKPMLN